MSSGYRYRSLFWPGLLILVGVIAFLVNTGVLSGDKLYGLLNLWPLILIVIGLELIVRRSVQGRTGELAAWLIVLVAAVGALAYVAVAPNAAATQTLDVSDSAGNLSQASAEIDVGAATINVSGSSSLGGDLYHAHIEYSGPQPDVSLNHQTGELRISQSNQNFAFFGYQHFVLNLELTSSVSWAISTNSGAATDTLNLADVQVRSIEVNTGASREEITLGGPSGIVPVTINGGALTVHVHRPSGTAASVSVSGGAVSLDADGRQSHSIGNAAYDSPGFGSATDGYRIEVNGGACTVSLDTNTPG
jgi:cell wall-active antibiotic response 4TMS protein YvqF